MKTRLITDCCILRVYCSSSCFSLSFMKYIEIRIRSNRCPDCNPILSPPLARRYGAKNDPWNVVLCDSKESKKWKESQTKTLGEETRQKNFENENWSTIVRAHSLTCVIVQPSTCKNFRELRKSWHFWCDQQHTTTVSISIYFAEDVVEGIGITYGWSSLPALAR